MSLQNEKPIEEKRGFTEREMWIFAVLALTVCAAFCIFYANQANGRIATIKTDCNTKIAAFKISYKENIAEVESERDENKRLYNETLQKLWKMEDNYKEEVKECDKWRARASELEKKVRELESEHEKIPPQSPSQ